MHAALARCCKEWTGGGQFSRSGNVPALLNRSVQPLDSDEIGSVDRGRLAVPIRVHGMCQEDRDADAAKDDLDHGCASWPISARYLLHDCCQIRLKMNCMTVRPLFVGNRIGRHLFHDVFVGSGK